MDRSFTLDRITATKAQIVAYEGALLALAAGGGVESYTLDTGQSRQTVTRANIPAMQKMLTALYNQLATLEARVYGGTTNVRPAW
jgi:hypothetical protein